ncbi:hypothetical protein ABK040_002698 [Willaertia magna]
MKRLNKKFNFLCNSNKFVPIYREVVGISLNFKINFNNFCNNLKFCKNYHVNLNKLFATIQTKRKFNLQNNTLQNNLQNSLQNSLQNEMFEFIVSQEHAGKKLRDVLTLFLEKNLQNTLQKNTQNNTQNSLQNSLQNLTNNKIRKMIENGNVYINNEIECFGSTICKFGDFISFFIIDNTLQNSLQNTQTLQPFTQHDTNSLQNSLQNILHNNSLQNNSLQQEILYEDNNFIAFNKPPNITTDLLNFTKINKKIKNNYFLVHRLDKETSGIILIAKNLKMKIFLENLFLEKLIKKTYLAICSNLKDYNNDYNENYNNCKDNDYNNCKDKNYNKNYNNLEIGQFGIINDGIILKKKIGNELIFTTVVNNNSINNSLNNSINGKKLFKNKIFKNKIKSEKNKSEKDYKILSAETHFEVITTSLQNNLQNNLQNSLQNSLQTHNTTLQKNNFNNFNNKYYLLKINPKTGRTHQIRVHLSKSLNLSILGDKLYGGKLIKYFYINRQMLHAYEIEFNYSLFLNNNLKDTNKLEEINNLENTNMENTNMEEIKDTNVVKMDKNGMIKIKAPIPLDFKRVENYLFKGEFKY